MNQKEIQERNKQIAMMLDTKLHESQLSMPHPHYTCYHSDWNWLMEAVEFIQELEDKLGDKENFKIFNRVLALSIGTKKETVFIAVSDFAKQYNENKK
jgi:hypothetical protein